jgi:hypothetical protein
MMHLVERCRAFACSGTTQPADEMQDLTFAGFVGGRQQFDHDLIHLS